MGYETMLEDGSYPEPDSREAFMNKGTALTWMPYYDGVRDPARPWRRRGAGWFM